MKYDGNAMDTRNSDDLPGGRSNLHRTDPVADKQAATSLNDPASNVLKHK